MIRSTTSVVFSLLAGLVLLAGCDEIKDSASSDSAESSEAQPVEISGPPPEIETGGHGDVGPNGGHIIELGRNHKFHAELVEDHESGIVRLFVLDGGLKELPIESPTVLLNLTSGGRTKNFELASARPGSRSAEFLTTDQSLFDGLHVEGAIAKLRVNIQGATYVGTLDHGAHDCECEHDHGDGHDHAGHNHSHAGHNH